MDAQPDTALLILEDVHIVIAAADRTELLGCELLLLACNGQSPGRVVLKERMIDRLLVLTPDAERDRVPDVVHDRLDVRLHFRGGRVQANGLVSAGDIVTDPRRVELVFVGHHAADGHGVPQVMVRHQRGGGRFTCAIKNLNNGVVEGISPDGHTVNHLDRHGRLVTLIA